MDGSLVLLLSSVQSIQSLSRVRLFATPWTATRQASLSITNSQSPPKLMSIELVMPSNHLILCRPLLLLPSIFPNIRVFSNGSALPHQVAKILRVSASASVLPVNTQDWFPQLMVPISLLWQKWKLSRNRVYNFLALIDVTLVWSYS